MIKIMEVQGNNKLIKKLNNGFYVNGFPIRVDYKKIIAMPIVVCYNGINNQSKDDFGYREYDKEPNIDDFLYSEDEKHNEELKKQIKNIYIVKEFNKKIELIKNQYGELTTINREKYNNKINSKFRIYDFLFAIFSILLTVSFVIFTDLNTIIPVVLGILTFFICIRVVYFYRDRDKREYYSQIDALQNEQKTKDIISLMFDNCYLLLIIWKRQLPTSHIILSKKGYEKWERLG